jgi:hypothetical protein
MRRSLPAVILAAVFALVGVTLFAGMASAGSGSPQGTAVRGLNPSGSFHPSGSATPSASGTPTPTPSSSYPPPTKTPDIQTSTTSGPPGSSVTVAGEDFSKNCGVTVRFDNTTIGQTTTNSSGDFSTSVKIPTDATVGVHDLTASDNCSTMVLGEKFTVTAPVSSGSNLPFTGFVFYPLLAGGALLVLAGVGLIFAGRRRRAGTLLSS